MKKTSIKIIFFLIILIGIIFLFLGLVLNFVSQGNKKPQQKYYIVDNMYEFSEGIAAVEKNNKVGFIDKTGKVVIDFKYDIAYDVYQFSEGIVAVEKEGKWGFIDKSGKTIVEFIYDDAYQFSEGIAAVEKAGKWGLINKQGEIITDFIYDEIASSIEYDTHEEKDPNKKSNYVFDNKYIIVQKDNKWGVIDTSGNVVLDFVYDSYGGVDFEKEDENRIYTIIKELHEGISVIEERNPLDPFSSKKSYINTNGEKTTIDDYFSVSSFSEGLSVVSEKFDYKYMDKDGNVVIEKTSDGENLYNSKQFSEGLAATQTFNLKQHHDKYGYIDKKGNVIINFIYDDAGEFSEGLAKVEKDNKWGFINKEGKIIVDLKFKKVYDFENGLARVTDFKNKIGFINKKGKIVIDNIYDNATNFVDGIALVEKAGEKFYINKNGKKLNIKSKIAS